MESGTKKVLIFSGVGVGVLVIVLLLKKSMAATSYLPIRTQVPGSAAVGGGVLNQLVNGVKSLVPVVAPAGFIKGSGGQLTTAAGVKILTYDPNTGAYEETDGTWYLKTGVPLNYYDVNNGVYQEQSDNSWYTFDGTSLAYYDATTGNYVEDVNPKVMYDNTGKVINTNVDLSTLLN